MDILIQSTLTMYYNQNPLDENRHVKYPEIKKLIKATIAMQN